MNHMTKSIPFSELKFNQITMYFIYLEFGGHYGIYKPDPTMQSSIKTHRI